MTRRHGWSGDLPATDEEAVQRILAATRRCIDQHGEDAGISEVARELGVTRQTIYRYFKTTRDLLTATAIDASSELLTDIQRHVRATNRDPDEVVVETIAYTVERIRERPYVGLLLQPSKSNGPEMGFTSEIARTLGRTLVDALPVDWAAAGYDDQELDALVHMMLRTLMTFMVDPGDPPLTGEEIRAYLRRWIAPAIAGTPTTRLAKARRR
jgi:AcrR family transcriptional regulator